MATWFQKFGSWINDNFHKDTRRDDGLGRFLNGIDSFWNRITGSGLTGAEIEANQYSAQQAELAFEREAEFYEKNQSVKAQITQQMETGINPFGIAGNASSGPVVSSASPSSVSPGSTTFDPLALAMQIARFKMDQKLADAQIGKTKAETENISADTVQINKNTEWIDRLNGMSLKESESVISKNAADILNSNADTQVKTAQLSEIAIGIANTEADISVKQQQLALMLAQTASEWKSVEQMSANIALMGSQAGLNRSQAKLISQEWRNLAQLFSHNEIMNALTELSASRDTGEAGAYYRVTSEVKRFIDSFLGWFSGGASIVSKK